MISPRINIHKPYHCHITPRLIFLGFRMDLLYDLLPYSVKHEGAGGPNLARKIITSAVTRSVICWKRSGNAGRAGWVTRRLSRADGQEEEPEELPEEASRSGVEMSHEYGEFNGPI